MRNKLKQYNDKRDFTKTKEPKGINSKTSSSKNKYSMQYHDASNLHFDLRLEYQGVLLSWAIPKGPSFNPKDKRLAIKVEDHPIDYLTFEGVIPKGEYGGGTVMVWDIGHFEPLNDFKDGLKKGILKFILYGKRLKGKWSLIRIKQEENSWLFIKETDAFSKKTASVSRYKKSIITDKTFNEIANNTINSVVPKPAKLVQNIPDGDEWIYEIKYDGYRIYAKGDRGNVSLFTRNHKDYTKYFSTISDVLHKLSKENSFIVDGEIVVIDKLGKTNFQLLQNHLKKGEQSPSYIIFDLIYLNGKDYSNIPLLERKKVLKKLLKNAKKPIFYSKHITNKNLRSLINAVNEFNLEGIIAKKKDSIYDSERNENWVKIKNRNTQEFLIGGYAISKKKHGEIKSLLLGAYKDKKLYYVGLVGSGISHDASIEILKKLKKLIRKTTPFYNKTFNNSEITYVTPSIIAQVEFSEWTDSLLLRQPSFKGIRNDKNPTEVKLEINRNE